MTTTPVSSKKRKDFLSPLIADPLEYDVVCAKDRFYVKHTGNLIFRAHIEATKNSYLQAKTKHEKKKVTKDFVNYLQSKYGSRFLKRHGNDWVEISELHARDKVSHALRFATRHLDGGNGEEKGENKASANSLSDASNSTGYNSDISPPQSDISPPQNSLTLDDLLDQIFKRQQQLFRLLQEGNDDDEILPNKSTSTPMFDSSSTECPPRHGSFICFQQKVKSSVMVPSDELLSEPLNTLQLECQNQQQQTTLELSGSSKHIRTSMCFTTEQQEDFQIEDMHQLLSEAHDFDVHETFDN